jgi:hypothetical protein
VTDEENVDLIHAPNIGEFLDMALYFVNLKGISDIDAYIPVGHTLYKIFKLPNEMALALLYVYHKMDNSQNKMLSEFKSFLQQKKEMGINHTIMGFMGLQSNEVRGICEVYV